MSAKNLNLTLRVWRQAGPDKPGQFETYEAKGISADASFLEMLDVVNEGLIKEGKNPIAFDHDCREGICGSCGCVINGHAHGREPETAVCQLHMRKFKDGETLVIEPFRANAFPVVRDLVVDRGAFDRIIQAGGYVSVRTGQAPEAHSVPVPKPDSDNAMDAAQCIGCGACVAACPNASAMLFVSAKVSHLNSLPQGKPEAHRRAMKMIQQHEKEGFGACSNHYECEAACPKAISVRHIAKLNRDHMAAALKGV